MPRLVGKFCNILNTISSRSSFGWPAICSLAWEETHLQSGINGPQGWLSISLCLLGSEYSSIPSTSGVRIPAGRPWPPSLTRSLRYVWLSVRRYSFPSAYSFPLGSCASRPPPGYWLLISSSIHLQIYMNPHLWLTLYPGPIFLLKTALKKGKPRTCLPSSFFLKMSVFLLLPNPVLKQHLKLDDSA